jgi:uncharacterized tellurite resistance protein B-like protein
MVSKKEVYEAFAELIYAVIMADGVVKDPEKALIKAIVVNHPIAQNIQLHLESGVKNTSIVQSFLHTLDVCKNHGQDNEYSFLLNILIEISKVSEGVDSEEGGFFAEFVDNFKKRFLLD